MMVAEIVGWEYVRLPGARRRWPAHVDTRGRDAGLRPLAYMYARKHATDSRLRIRYMASSATWRDYQRQFVLAMIALLIGYEAVSRFLFGRCPSISVKAIPIAVVGLLVNVASSSGFCSRPDPFTAIAWSSKPRVTANGHDEHVTKEEVQEVSFTGSGVL